MTKIVSITLGRYLPNPGLPSGKVQFNASRTGSYYYRYSCDVNGIDTLLFINANMIHAFVPHAIHMQGVTIEIDQDEWTTNWGRQKPQTQKPVLAITNFTLASMPSITGVQATMNVSWISLYLKRLWNALTSKVVKPVTIPYNKVELPEEAAIITTDHPRWAEFYKLLNEKVGSPQSSNCHHTFDHSISILMTSFSNVDLYQTLKYFREKGAHCDCEVLMNIE